MKHVKSRIFFITGAASGIGAATARAAAAAGHKVVVADINLAGATALAESLGGAAMALALDITSPAQWDSALDAAWARFGRVDVLINNAAVVHTGYARDVSIERHGATMATNFMGPLSGMLKVLPRFRAQGSGHLVTVCSMTAFLPFPGIASYAASKHALRAFHHALMLEERDGPVVFTIVHPTATETPMLEQEAQDDAVAMAFAGPSVTAETVAEVIMTAIRRRSVEVFMPPERGRVVRRVGTSPRALRALVERNEAIGAIKQKERRAAAGQS